MSEQELKALEGAYWNELTDEVRRLSIKGGKLMAGGSSDALVPIGGGRFRAGETSAQIAFPAVASGGVQDLQVLSPPLPVSKFKRVVVPTLTQDELAVFVGTFLSSELEATFRVVVTDDGRLEWRSARGKPETLRPLMRDTFTLFNFGTITFTRGNDRVVTGMTISTGRVRRLALTKTGPGQ